jgi:hypothetical protein
MTAWLMVISASAAPHSWKARVKVGVYRIVPA